MADPRTFVLIGNFTDNITPALERINNSIAKLKGNLSDLSNATRPLKSDFRSLASLSKNFNDSLKSQSTDIKQMTTALKAFRSEMGRVNRAYRAGGSRVMRQAAAPPPAPPSYPTPRGGGGGRGYAAAVGGAVGGSVLGAQLGDAVTGSIVKGFQIGVSIMEKPFQYFASALGERIRDEMSDIKAAGGYFSIAKRQEQPFVKTFDQALEFTQKNNAVLAKLAASLPGSTQDYIEVSKRIGDSVARTVMQDKGAAVAYANELRRQFPTMYGGQLQGAGVEAQRGAITTLLGELTKKTVLAGQGGRSGAGGAIGPYGLPGLTERMLSQDEVSMGQFQRYSAIFSDPMIMDALQREIPKINATAKNSIERFKALQKFYDDVLPPEMIEKYRRSIAGLQEAFNTAIMGPETGLFGLGRKMKGLGKKINDFGQFVDQFGNVVTDVNMAAEIDLSVFDMLRDILANTAQVLMPVIENITMLWDPLRQIGMNLKDARHFTANFLKSFNQYREGIEQYAKMLGKGMGAKLLETKDLRASFASLANLLKQLGVFDSAEFKSISKKILDPNANLGEILKGLIDTFLNSDAAFKIGEFIGNLVGTVLSEVAKAMGFVTGMATGGPLAKGLVGGFEAAGGSAAFASIIQNTFSLLGKLLLEVVKAAPLQTAVLGALMLLPAAISGMISAAVASCSAKMQGIAGSCGIGGGGGGRGGRRGRAGRYGALEAAGYGYGDYRGRPRRYGAGGSLDRLSRMRRYKMGQVGQFGVDAAGLGYNLAGRPGAGMAKGLGRMFKGAGRMTRGIPGGALAGGALDLGIALASGENFGKAAVGAFGTVLGGAAGSIFGPVGTVIGSMAGGALADASYSVVAKMFDKPSAEQVKAAGIQLQAASFQKQAADMQEAGVTGTNLFGTFKELSQRLEVLGIKGKEADAIKTEYAYREELTKRAKADAKALKEAVDRMVEAGLDPEKIAAATKGLKTASDKSAKELEESNRRLQQAFNKLPDTVENALYRSLSQMSTVGISAMLAQKIGEIKMPTPAFTLPSTLPPTNPYSPGYKPTSPLLNGQGFQWQPNATSSTGNIFQWRAKGGLGDAIASEMKNKPSGSNLVIANSSETVIPAAGGYGMKDFMDILASGFTAVNRQYQSLATGVNVLKTDTSTQLQHAETRNEDRHQKTTTSINNYQKLTQSEFVKINQNIAALTQQVSTMSSMGGMMGAGGMALGGGYGSAGVQIAGQLGNYIKATGGAPGSIWEHPMHGGVKGRHAPGSYHYSGRAIDIGAYAGEQAGVIARIKQFNAQYGVKPVEFLHAGNDPNHQDHVHVAYAQGFGNPAFFSSQRDAVAWEKQHLGKGVKSITSNSAEIAGLLDGLFGQKPDIRRPGQKPTVNQLGTEAGYGLMDRRREMEEAIRMMRGGRTSYVSPEGLSPFSSGSSVASSPINITAPITINQQPGQDADELASIVALKIGEAVSDARASSIFV